MSLFTEQQNKTNLIVILPAVMVNSIELAHTINRIAARENRDVIYLTIKDNDHDVLDLSRGMATMKAVTAEVGMNVQWIQTNPKDWLNKLCEVYRPGDQVICNEEQTIDNGFLKTVKIDEVVKDRLDIDVHRVSGFYPVQEGHVTRFRHELLSLVVFLVIMASFSWLEIQADRSMSGVAGIVVVFLLFCFELGIIWFWNDFINS